MKKILLPLAAASALLVATGCNNTSTENQSTNAPAEQPPPAMSTNSPSAGTPNAAPSAGADTNSAGMETNNPATTNSMAPP